MRISIYSILILAVIVFGFIWFLGETQAAVEEEWDVDDDSVGSTIPPVPPDTGYIEYTLDDGVAVEEDTGEMDTYVETDGQWRVRIRLDIYLERWVNPVYTGGPTRSIVPTQPTGEEFQIFGPNLCREVSTDFLERRLIRQEYIDIASIITPGERLDKIDARVIVCVVVDYMEVPRDAVSAKLIVDGREVPAEPYPPDVLAVIYNPSIKDGKPVETLAFSFKLVYTMEDGSVKTHEFGARLEITVKWKAIETFERGVAPDQTYRQRCIERYMEFLEPPRKGMPGNPFQTEQDVIEFCSRYTVTYTIYGFDDIQVKTT